MSPQPLLILLGHGERHVEFSEVRLQVAERDPDPPARESYHRKAFTIAPVSDPAPDRCSRGVNELGNCADFQESVGTEIVHDLNCSD